MHIHIPRLDGKTGVSNLPLILQEKSQTGSIMLPTPSRSTWWLNKFNICKVPVCVYMCMYYKIYNMIYAMCLAHSRNYVSAFDNHYYCYYCSRQAQKTYNAYYLTQCYQLWQCQSKCLDDKHGRQKQERRRERNSRILWAYKVEKDSCWNTKKSSTFNI